jgi:hypothetical protein
MRLLKEALGILGAFVVLAVIVAFVAPNRARAVAATLVQIVPGTTTHVGQHESQLVSLRCFEGKAYCSQTETDGNILTNESTPYVVPKGYTLILTDYEWQGSANGPGLISDFLYNAAITPGSEFTAGVAPAIPTGVDYNAYGHEHYSTGVRVGSGVTLADYQAEANSGASLIQGYLVPND